MRRTLSTFFSHQGGGKEREETETVSHDSVVRMTTVGSPQTVTHSLHQREILCPRVLAKTTSVVICLSPQSKSCIDACHKRYLSSAHVGTPAHRRWDMLTIMMVSHGCTHTFLVMSCVLVSSVMFSPAIDVTLPRMTSPNLACLHSDLFVFVASLMKAA